MNPIPLHEICLATRGTTMAPGCVMVTNISNNSKDIQPGGMYVAIRGETHDGHKFIADATAHGAVTAMVERIPSDAPRDLHYIVVPDTRRAFGNLAAAVRWTLRSKVIDVAGSNGKTSTKKLIDHVLRSKLTGLSSPKSFNNDIGVPLTMLQANPADDFLVLEIGTNHHGEIHRLAEITRPDIAVITSIGAEHLEHLGDLAGVRRENAEILAGLKPTGTLIVNGDDVDFLAAVADFPGRRITFGFSPHNDLFATEIRCTADGVHFRLSDTGANIFVPLLGRHTASNALAAVLVGREMGLCDWDLITSLATAHGADMRLELTRVGNDITLINDAYNANPTSMRAGLQTLVDLPAAGRRVAILGDMLELGPVSEKYHQEVGQLAADAKLDLLICVGPQSKLMGDVAGRAGLSVKHYPSAADAAKEVPSLLRRGDLTLLKASRGIHLEQVAAALAPSKKAS
jgi:UDP-N-acetylmuramoyl-tripeptide--D-alanyl-D-alanine ligase